MVRNKYPAAESVKQARWKGAGFGDYTCSLCDETVSGRPNDCPSCGADMQSEADSIDMTHEIVALYPNIRYGWRKGRIVHVETRGNMTDISVVFDDGRTRTIPDALGISKNQWRYV